MDEQLLHYFTGNLSTNKLPEMLQRIDNDEELKDNYIRLQNLNALSKQLPHSSDKKEGLQSFEQFMLRVKRRTRRVRTRKLLTFVSLAAILMVSTVWCTLLLQDLKTDAASNTLYVPAGQRARITLQDGTQVWLNAHSTLKYPSRFSNKNRKVEISGEAFFNISKGNTPFIVSTQNLELEVLGTQFNLYSYPDMNFIQADLVEGSLKIMEKSHPENTIMLAADEQMIFRENKMTVNPISNPSHMLWREGIYSFENEPLEDIIKKLQLYYDLTIIVEDPDILNVQYTGKFRQRDGIDEILRIIQKIHPFKIKKNIADNTITLSR